MQLFYRLVYAQLPQNLTGKKILDFGTGFGWTANYLTGLGNEVLAIEPNQEMLENHLAENPYEMRRGDISELKRLPDESFDFIVCHNVLEYAPERREILAEFEWLLRADGEISLIKHNFNGSLMQRIVFENKLDEALGLLNGEIHNAQNFGPIYVYELSDLIENLALEVDKIYGLQAFSRLQPNDFKVTEGWLEKMFDLESSLAENPDFYKIAFFNHLILKKSVSK